MWVKIAIVALAFLFNAVVTLRFYGKKRWQTETRILYEEVKAAEVTTASVSHAKDALEEVPAPVRRYFREVLEDGQPSIARLEVEHRGAFNMSETGEKWRRFESTQHIVTRMPGFVWDARIQMVPGMPVHVRDAYVGGKGILIARLFGLMSVMEQPNTRELAQGELMRFLAESVWHPTSLLPGQGLVWEAIDNHSARAILNDSTISACLVFDFDDRGLITSVYSSTRYREVNGEQVKTPWRGFFWDYEKRDGMMIPLKGEVGWMLSEGLLPYWRAHIERIEYVYSDDHH